MVWEDTIGSIEVKELVENKVELEQLSKRDKFRAVVGGKEVTQLDVGKLSDVYEVPLIRTVVEREAGLVIGRDTLGKIEVAVAAFGARVKGGLMT